MKENTTSVKIKEAPSGKDSYLKKLFRGIGTLLTGLKVTGREFFTRKVTEQYPENRRDLKMFDRFRGTLTMPHDRQGNNRCIACGLCQTVCPNDTIRITADTVTDPETGRKKKVLVRYEYDLGSCMFCQLCVNTCPHHAIAFDTSFEHAVYDRSKLVLALNRPAARTAELQNTETAGKTGKEPAENNSSANSDSQTEK